MMIGCKTDLRMDKERLRKLKSSQQEPVTYFQVIQYCLWLSHTYRFSSVFGKVQECRSLFVSQKISHTCLLSQECAGKEGKILWIFLLHFPMSAEESIEMGEVVC